MLGRMVTLIYVICRKNSILQENQTNSNNHNIAKTTSNIYRNTLKIQSTVFIAVKKPFCVLHINRY